MDGLSFGILSVYDSRFGDLKVRRFPNGQTVGFSYTNNGFPTGEYDPGTSAPYRYVQSRDAFGQITNELFGNGLVGDYEYSPSEGVALSLTVRDASNASTRQLFRYAYDDPRTLLTKRTNVLRQVQESFAYDSLQRITLSDRRWWMGAANYDPQYETDRAMIEYDYDKLGNITRKSDYGAQYIYGSSARNLPSNAGPHAIRQYLNLKTGVVADFQYDDAGNMIHGDGRSIVYNAYNQPIDISQNSDRVSYAYGPGGERYRRVDIANNTIVATTYRIDDRYEVVVENGGVTERAYVGDKLLFRKVGSATEVLYRHPDRLGSAVLITDGGGNTIDERGFGPFGAPRDGDWRGPATLQSAYTQKGFTGHEHIDSVHLIHMGGRGYDYQLGRFISIDPYADVDDMQSHNGYSYVRNNALNRIDPTGYQDTSIEMGCAEFPNQEHCLPQPVDEAASVKSGPRRAKPSSTKAQSDAASVKANEGASPVQEGRAAQEQAAARSDSQSPMGLAAALGKMLGETLAGMNPVTNAALSVVELGQAVQAGGAAGVAGALANFIPGMRNAKRLGGGIRAMGRSGAIGNFFRRFGQGVGQARSWAGRQAQRVRSWFKGSKACFVAGTLVLTASVAVPIESLAVGDSVSTTHSLQRAASLRLVDGEDSLAVERNHEPWVRLDLIPSDDTFGSDPRLSLLRPASWLAQQREVTEADDLLYLELGEIEMRGWMRISALSTLGKPTHRSGRTVLATVSRLSNDVYEVSFVEGGEPLRGTGLHPLYSLDRDEWVRVRDLLVGERLQTAEGAVTVEALEKVRGVYRVYNLEVEGDHEYLVGEAGVRAHNNGCGDETFEILDGVRRSKANEMLGNSTVRANIQESSKTIGTADIPVDKLLSPKKCINCRGPTNAKRMSKVVEEVRSGMAKPIDVQRGTRGTPIADVELVF